MPDPTFAGFEPTALAAGLALWGPPVQIGNVEIVPVDDATQAVEVTFR